MHLVRHMRRAPYESVAAPVPNNAADLVELNNVAAPNQNCRTELSQTPLFAGLNSSVRFGT